MRCRRALLIIAASCVPPALDAQAPAGSDRLSASAVVESLAVLKTLRDSVVREYRAPTAWYRQGMIAWVLNERCRHAPTVKELDCTRTRLLADTAFMIAEELDPTNEHYTSTRMRYLLTSEGTFHREGPYLDRLLKSGVARLRDSPDTLRRADGLLDLGRLYWLRYDGAADREWETTPSLTVLKEANRRAADSAKRSASPTWTQRDLVKAVRAEMDGQLLAQRKGSFWGELDYLNTEKFYREAYAVAPGYIRAFRALASLLVERGQWGELRALATERTTRLPADGWAWMTRGLAEYHLRDKRHALASYDSAHKYLGDADRNRIIRIERVLNSTERAEYARDQQTFEAMFWALKDPLWSNDDDDPRLEFLARVSYAELLWTADEIGMHGVNTDRGQTVIRRGPPDRVATTKKGRGNFGSLLWEWDYPWRSQYMPRIVSFKTDWYHNDPRIADGQSADWLNLVEGRIDTIPFQAARFRTISDSIDVFVASQPRISLLRQANQVVGPVRTDFWIKTASLADVVHDSIASDSDGPRSFTRRVAPGEYIYRVESFAPASRIAARATGRLTAGSDERTGFTSRGFGVSDMLLATRATSRVREPERWTAIDVAPVLGRLPSRASLSLVWETYELTNVNGQAEYDVVVTIANEIRGRRPIILARMAGILGLQRESYPDRVEFKFARTVPHRSTIVENVALGLQGTPPGSYRVSITVYDRANGNAAATTRRVDVTR